MLGVQEEIEEEGSDDERGFAARVEPASERGPVLIRKENPEGGHG